MKPGKDPRKTKQAEMSKDSVLTGFHSGRIYRKKRKAKKRHANHVERSGLREALGAAKKDAEQKDLDSLSEIPSGKISRSRKIYTESSNKKEWMLNSRKRKIRAELKNKADVFEFLVGMTKSESLYAIIAIDFFRYVLSSRSYPQSHPYRIAIDKAMGRAALKKSIEKKWLEFDKAFPGKRDYLYW